MKYQVNKVSKDKCKITLLPETSAEVNLLANGDELIIEQHYQRAIKSRFGFKAHFLCVTNMESLATVTAMFVTEN